MKATFAPEVQNQAGQLAQTVLARCDALAACTEQEGMIDRPFLSPAMERCNELVGSWMREAGLDVSVDQAGNLHGLYRAESADAPRLIVASHLDTVPNAGRYDGVLGAMLGLALVESLGGRWLPFAIEVIGFSDEEGVRYGLPFLGSRALVQELTPEHYRLRDARGVALGTALEQFAATHAALVPARLHARSRAYLEFHIEQGPVLDEAQQALAAVNAIAGQSRATVTFVGRAGHAGTTPMLLRRDAMTAAAEWILAVELEARATPGVVASTGRVVCEPGASNIIPGQVRCSLDVRCANDELRQRMLRELLDAARSIGEQRGVGVESTVDAAQNTVMLDERLTALAREAVDAVQGPLVRDGGAAGRAGVAGLVSGAGHDAMILAPHVPSTMIFLRSPAGVSHHPEEAVVAGDVAMAIGAGMHFLAGLERWMKENDRG